MALLVKIYSRVSSTKLINHQCRFGQTLQLLMIFQFSWTVAVNCLQFHKADFSDITNINLQKTAFQSDSFIQLLPVPDPRWYTDPNNSTATKLSTGWMSYTQAVPLLLTDTATQQVTSQSFNTSFTFQFLTPGTYSDCPSGMAFFVTPYYNVPTGVSNTYFGLSTGIDPEFFAVEFDTRQSLSTTDPSSSHVGIDISSVNSSAVVDTLVNFYPQLYLYNNYTFRAWVSYDAPSQLISVWMTNQPDDYSTYLDPPDDYTLSPILQFQQELSSVFSTQSNLYIGFSAATQSDSSMLGVSIYSWYFSVNDSSGTAASPPPQSPTNTPSTKSSGSSSKIRYEIIIPAAVGGFLVIALAVVVFFCFCRRKKPAAEGGNKPERNRNGEVVAVVTATAEHGNGSGTTVEDTPSNTSGGQTQEFRAVVTLPRYSFQQLQQASNNFSSLLGEGTYSRVYRGTLPNGSAVAIKRLKDGVRKEAEFFAELTMINTIRHRNLLQLQGWCYGNGEALLVYTFMSNGNLREHLLGERRGTLNGETRLRILSNVAAALEYLHFGLGKCVLHRDVKSGNVFLTENFDAVLGDFGLVRLADHNEVVVTGRVAGTPGYMAPEVIGMGEVTEKVDVYSFGVLILEVASGCQVFTKRTTPGPHVYIVEHVSQLQRYDRLGEAIDPAILKLNESMKSDEDQSNIERIHNYWIRILELGLLCCEQNPESRPNMRYVHQEIMSIVHSAGGHNNNYNIGTFPSPAGSTKSSVRSPAQFPGHRSPQFTKYSPAHIKRNSQDPTSWSVSSGSTSTDRTQSTSVSTFVDVYDVTPR